MPVASRSVSQGLLGADYTEALGGKWFAWFTAALMLGAAIGGSLLGNLGDRVGRARAMGVSILFYSCLPAWGRSSPRPSRCLCYASWSASASAACGPTASPGRRVLAERLAADRCRRARRGDQRRHPGAVATGARSSDHAGRLALDFSLAAVPAVLGILVLALLPSRPSGSPRGARQRDQRPDSPAVSRQAVPLTLSASCSPPCRCRRLGRQQMDDPLGRSRRRHGPSRLQSHDTGYWAVGATLGGFLGAPLAAWIGRRRSYFLISLGATALTCRCFCSPRRWKPRSSDRFAQGLVATLYFGWLPLYLPELFPVEVRATGPASR